MFNRVLPAVIALTWVLAASPCVAQGDEFTAPSLAPHWFWIREDPTHWSLKTRPGYLRITTQRGDIAGTLHWDSRNLLVQGTRAGDFVLQTRVRIQPSYDFQQGGLIVYANDDNYVKLVRSHVLKDGGNVMELIDEQGGKMKFLSLRLLAQEVYLRLTRSGTTYKGEYSLSGKPAEWFTVGSTSATLSAPKVGLIAISGPLLNVPELPVDFDYFRGSGPGFGSIAPNVVGTPSIGTVVFVDLAAEPDAFYYVGAAFGKDPGIPLGTRTLPLTSDPLLFLTVHNLLGGIFNHFSGYLNSRGEARAWMNLPNNTSLVGQVFYLAFITLDSGQPLGIGTISDATQVKISL